MFKKGIMLVLSFVIALSFAGCGKKQADFSETKAICELATLKCYYHNTSEFKEDSSSIGKLFGKIGYKKAWIEYDGIVKLGVKASDIKIEPKGNKVSVYIPDAEVLSVDIDTDSISEAISETGWFTKITTEERSKAQKNAQEEMKTKARNNTELLSKAKQRAKETIKNYIINVGELIGVEYEIEWIDASNA